MGKVLENSGASQEQFVMCCRRIREKKVLNKGKAHSRCNKFYLNNKFSSRMRSVRLGFYSFLFSLDGSADFSLSRRCSQDNELYSENSCGCNFA